MKRTIKFRIWNNKTKSWIHGPADRNDLDGINILGETILLGGFLDGVSIKDLNEIEVLQFTGLKDSVGRDIFEGDILRIPENDPESTASHGLVLVEYKYGSFGYTDTLYKNKRFDSLYSLLGESEVDDCAEIVGNMYDNPDLLN